MASKHYTSSFKTLYDREYTIEIWSKTDNTGSGIEYDLSSEGFILNYDKGTHLRLAETMPSSVSFGFIIKTNTERTFVTSLLQASRGDWYIKIFRTGEAQEYWAGWIEPGFDNYKDESYPYKANIRATDSLDVIIDKYTNAVNITGDNFRNLRYPMEVFRQKYDIDSLFTTPKFNFAMSWVNNQSSAGNTDRTSDTFYNRQAFVDNPTNFPNIIRNINTELIGVLKALGLRLFFSQGEYRLIQDNLFPNTHNEFIYNDPTSSSPDETRLNEFNSVEIDNTQSPDTANKGIALTGGTHTFDPEFNSVRAKFIFDDAGVLFDPSSTYSSLTTIGIIGGGSSNMLLTLNLETQQTHSMPNPAGPYQPPANAIVSNSTNTIFSCTFKCGTYYLNCNILVNVYDNASGVSVDNFSWSTDSSNRVELQGLGDHAQYHPNFIYAYPNATSTMSLSVVDLEIPPPPIYGELQFSFDATITFLNAIPSLPLSSSYDDIIVATAATGSNPWWNGNAPVTTSQSINPLILAGAYNLIQCALAFSTNNDTNIGAVYMAQQNPAVSNPDFNLGDINLGVVVGDSDSIKTLAYDNSGVFTPITGMAQTYGDTNISPTLLLCREYLKGQQKPVNIFQGSIQSTSYEAFKILEFPEYVGASNSKWVFVQGKYTASQEQWNGSWYKIELDTSTLTETTDTDNNPFPAPTPGPGPTPVPFPDTPKARLVEHNINTSLLSIFKSQTIGVLTSAFNAGTHANDTKISIDSINCDVLINQKLMLCDNNGGNFTDIDAYAAVSEGGTQLPIKAKTTARDYPIGSVVLIKSNDLTNVITGGSTSPAGSDTQVQFNNSGSFGASAELTFDGTILSTSVLLATDTDESPTAQVALEDADGNRIAQLARLGSGGNAHIGQLVLRDNATAKVQIKASGSSYINSSSARLGIGNSSPTKELDVTGSALISGDVVITGDLNADSIVYTEVRILPSDFIADDVGRPLMIDDSTGDRWLESHSTAKMYASVQIPKGRTATQLIIYGSGTSAVTVYEATIDSDTVTSKGTGNIGSVVNFTDVTHSSGNYLLIELAQTSTEKVYGGKVTLT